MASFSGLAGKVRSITESDEFDLGSISSAYDAGRLITDAFSTPFSERDEMVRVTFVVGAGKANRQKYDASLQKWIVAALKAMPTDEEIRARGCDDAATYLIELKGEAPAEYDELLVTKRCGEMRGDGRAVCGGQMEDPQAGGACGGAPAPCRC